MTRPVPTNFQRWSRSDSVDFQGIYPRLLHAGNHISVTAIVACLLLNAPIIVHQRDCMGRDSSVWKDVICAREFKYHQRQVMSLQLLDSGYWQVWCLVCTLVTTSDITRPYTVRGLIGMIRGASVDHYVHGAFLKPGVLVY